MPCLRLASLMAIFLACATLQPAAAAPPNILLIVSDDQAWNDYGFMGHPRVATPRLDELASQSAVFPRGYVPTSLCRPSLATLITGLYPHQHGVTGNDPKFARQPGVPLARHDEYLRKNRQYIERFAQRTTLPRLLAAQGYASLQTGKWWEGDFSRGGFSSGMTHGDPARGGRHGDAGLAIGREGLQPIFDFIHEHRDQPWFVWYAPLLPHSPHNPPQRLLEKYDRDVMSVHVARYLAMCEWFDETCGALLDFLRDHQLERNTLVVYVADNGWIQDPQSPQFAPRSKRSPYEGGIRTPILLRWPGRIAPARYEQALVSSIDLAPTILAAAGAAPPAGLPGLDLLQVCNDAGCIERDAVFGATFEHDMPDLDHPAAGLMFRWVIAGDWKLIVPADSAAEHVELYNLSDDPAEHRDLSTERAETVQELTSKLDDWWRPFRERNALR